MLVTDESGRGRRVGIAGAVVLSVFVLTACGASGNSAGGTISTLTRERFTRWRARLQLTLKR